MTNEEILNIKLDLGGAKTIREYFVMCAAALWQEGESFSGKRPISDSSWQTDIYIALVRAGAVQGVIDEDGELDECDYDAADEMVTEAIESMAIEVKPEPKRQMVLFESCISEEHAAIDPTEVVAITHDGAACCVYLRGGNSEGSGYYVRGTMPEVATKLGIELVESKGTVK